jgi:hypothetical protein
MIDAPRRIRHIPRMIHLKDRIEELEKAMVMLEQRHASLLGDLKNAEAELNQARGRLFELRRLDEEQALAAAKRNPEAFLQIPSIKLADAVEKAAVALRQFKREDLEDWIRSNYPQMQFSRKSVDRPMRDLMAAGKIILLRPNTGNKIPAIYGWAGSSPGETAKKQFGLIGN